MDYMSLIISKQHSTLLLWVESILFSTQITYELDRITPKGMLPVALPDTASIPHHYCHLRRRFHWPSKAPWGRLPDVVCQLVGAGTVQWCLIRAEDTNLSLLFLEKDVDYCDHWEYWSVLRLLWSLWVLFKLLLWVFRKLLLDYFDYSDYLFWIIRNLEFRIIFCLTLHMIYYDPRSNNQKVSNSQNNPHDSIHSFYCFCIYLPK